MLKIYDILSFIQRKLNDLSSLFDSISSEVQKLSQIKTVICNLISEIWSGVTCDPSNISVPTEASRIDILDEKVQELESDVNSLSQDVNSFANTVTSISNNLAEINTKFYYDKQGEYAIELNWSNAASKIQPYGINNDSALARLFYVLKQRISLPISNNFALILSSGSDWINDLPDRYSISMHSVDPIAVPASDITAAGSYTGAFDPTEINFPSELAIYRHNNRNYTVPYGFHDLSDDLQIGNESGTGQIIQPHFFIQVTGADYIFSKAMNGLFLVPFSTRLKSISYLLEVSMLQIDYLNSGIFISGVTFNMTPFIAFLNIDSNGILSINSGLNDDRLNITNGIKHFSNISATSAQNFTTTQTHYVYQGTADFWTFDEKLYGPVNTASRSAVLNTKWLGIGFSAYYVINSTDIPSENNLQTAVLFNVKPYITVTYDFYGFHAWESNDIKYTNISLPTET